MTVPSLPLASPAPAKPRRLRSIRFQVVAALSFASILVALVLLPLGRHEIDTSFAAFESAYARQEAHRLDVLFAEQARALERTAIDYSRWDEAVAYVAHPDPGWVKENISDDVFENFGAERIAIVDARAAPIVIRTTPDATLHPMAAVAAVEAALCRDSMRRHRPLHRFDLKHGLPHATVCSPISSPHDPAFVPGAMLWVVELSGKRLATIRDLARFDFTLVAPDRGASSAPRVDGDRIRLRQPLADWDGRIGLQADLALARPLGAQRQLVRRVILALIALALVLPALVALLLLELLVVRRIQRMSQWVRGMRRGGTGTLDRRLKDIGDGRAGFAELQMLGADVAALAAHLDSLRADWQTAALRDSLTGLRNRACLVGDLDGPLGRGDALGLMLIDLDGFKSVNDLLGHGVGDTLLREVAAAMEAALPDEGRAYRLGGDEFAVVLAGFDEARTEALAGRMVEQLRFVRQTASRPLVVSASIGVAITPPDRPVTPSALLTEADSAMYDAKRLGRGQWRRMSRDRRIEERQQIELTSALRAALAERRITAWFQPIVAADDRRLLAVEALARWDEADWGSISPERFIPVAERAHLIVDLDLQVIAVALPVLAALRRSHPDVVLHTNVSSQSLAEPTFVSRFMRLLADSGLPPTALRLELTESDLAVRHEQLEHALQHMRRAGVGLAVDDFGVGASSLARLAALKPDEIKIDGAFVRDLDGDGGTICRVIIELARELGLSCAAEYVEQDAQANRLASIGCRGLQGFGIAAPMPANDLVAWASARCPAAA